MAHGDHTVRLLQGGGGKGGREKAGDEGERGRKAQIWPGI